MRLNFIFGPIEAEVAAKNASLLSPPEPAERALVDYVRERLGEDGLTKVRHALDYARSMPSRSSHHPKLAAYFSHPLRVALFASKMEMLPDPETLQIGLIHNVFEICGASEADVIEAGFSPTVARSIRLLTVDRQRQNDVDYLTAFCAAIEADGDRLALIRCVDKLDNLLGLELFPEGPERSLYIDLAVRFVAPMADRLSAEFGCFFRAVADYIKRVGGQPELVRKHREFVAAIA